jgi:hypothetical protein
MPLAQKPDPGKEEGPSLARQRSQALESTTDGLQTTAMTGVHDLGGQSAGPVDRTEHEPTLFDQRIDAMIRLLTHPSRAVFTVDAMRRAIESHPAEDYFGLTYYEKWLHAIRRLTIEQGVISEAELARKLDVLRERARSAKP